MEPRIVVVTRPTPWEQLVGAHGTAQQARWFVERQGGQLEAVQRGHERRQAALHTVLTAIPGAWRHTRIDRAELDRFGFEPDDVVVVVGPDGLVANAAKYLDAQRVIGVNPDPSEIDGVLVKFPPRAVRDLFRDVEAGRGTVEVRTRVEATTDDGQRLLALNEVFVGHRTHQSARYTLGAFGRTERQSSSGLIVATGTGATGWAASIARGSAPELVLPAPTEAVVALLVREPWPSRTTGTTLRAGRVDDAVTVVSEMDQGGVMFGDGIEADAVALPYARTVTLRRAPEGLRLVA